MHGSAVTDIAAEARPRMELLTISCLQADSACDAQNDLIGRRIRHGTFLNVLPCPTSWHKEIGRPTRSRAATFHFVCALICTNASPVERTA